MTSRIDIDAGVSSREVRGRFYPLGKAWVVQLVGEDGRAYIGRGVTLSLAFEDAFRDCDHQRTRWSVSR